MAVNVSTDSVIFYDGDKKLNSRFNISFSIDDSRNFSQLSKVANIDSNAPVWLSWTLFEKTIQTDEFPNHSAGISNYKDTVLASCTDKAIMDQFPVRIYLCTHERILGVTEVTRDIFRHIVDPIPVNSTNWMTFSLDTNASSASNVDVSIQLTVGIDRMAKESDVGGNGILSHGGAAVGASASASASGDEYDDEEFDDNGSQAGVTQQPTAVDAESESVISAEEELEGGRDKDKKRRSRGNHSKKHRAHFADSAKSGDSDDGGQGDENENDKQPDEAVFVDEFQDTHFRLSIDIRTIGGLKRASHVSLQFVYPHLGSNAHIRSQPMWVRGATEAKVEGAVAVYDFCMTKAACKSVCSTNPLHVHILAKTNLGNEPFAEFAIDLSALLTAKIHSVRCPSTNRSFKHLADYAQHRTIMQQQQQSEIAAGNGVFTVIPPSVPIITRAIDTYYDASEVRSGPTPQGPGAKPSQNHGGQRVAKVRVLLILEDIGAVVGGGARSHAVPVKPGYKHGGAAVYQQEGPHTHQVDQQGGGGDNNSGARQAPPNHQGVYPPAPDGSAPTDEYAERRFEERVEREVAKIKKKLAMDMSKHYANKADDLRKAQEETNKLEMKLRTTIESAEKQKNNLILQEEQMNMKLIQKTHELQLLQKRVRDEATVKIEAEVRKSTSLQQECDKFKEDLKKERVRYKEVDEMYDRLKNAVKNMSEMQLKEEVAKIRTQYLDCKAELERERRQKAEANCEKEHYRAQMHRVALALKREREKNATIARQDLEQLRLEYLAREERYVTFNYACHIMIS